MAHATSRRSFHLHVCEKTAYWIDYGCSLHIAQSTKQWRVPVAIQLIPGGLMFIGLFFLKESPRWLMRQGRHEEAQASLAYIRNEPQDSEEVLKEFSEIRASLEEELAATEGVTWKEAISKSNRFRFFLAFCLMFWQQFSGTNSIGYYAPEIFQTVGVKSTNTSLFATGVYGSVKVVMTLIFLLVGIDFIGRKKALIGGGLWMSAMMIILGAVLATHPPDTKSDGVSPPSIAMIVLIYLYVMGYSASWGPTPWVYVSEVSLPFLSPPTRFHPFFFGDICLTEEPTDLPNPSPCIWCWPRRRNPMALQLRHHRNHPQCRQPHRLAHIPHVRHLLSRHEHIRHVLHQGDQGSKSGGYGYPVWKCG